MLNFLSNIIIAIFLIFSLNGCSTISNTIDLAGIVDKTENFIFGNDEEKQEEQQQEQEVINNNAKKQEIDEENFDIVDIPTEKPDFSDIEKDFFEGETKEEPLIKENNEVIEEIGIEKKAQSTPERKNIELISKISQNVRIRVRTLLLNSDPPTSNKGSVVSYQKEESNSPSYSDEDKIAVFYFPNNSVIPDTKAENVINEIVKFYSNSSLLLVGHASSLGGNSPKGKKINMEISFARAEAIKNMLINKGFLPEDVTVLGKGDLEPSIKTNANNKDGDDRRVEVFLFSN